MPRILIRTFLTVEYITSEGLPLEQLIQSIRTSFLGQFNEFYSTKMSMSTATKPEHAFVTNLTNELQKETTQTAISYNSARSRFTSLLCGDNSKRFQDFKILIQFPRILTISQNISSLHRLAEIVVDLGINSRKRIL